MKYYLLIIISLLGFFSTTLMIVDKLHSKSSYVDAQYKSQILVNKIAKELKFAIEPFAANVASTAKSHRLLKMLEDPNNKSWVRDFAFMTRSHQHISQFRVLDTTGMEIFRINYYDDSLEVVSQEHLRDKSNRNYFKEATRLGENQVYLSPINMNIEDGVIAQPLEAVLRIIAPIENGERIGYLVYNLSIDRLLNHLYDFNNLDSSRIWILESDGKYVIEGSADGTQYHEVAKLKGEDATFLKNFKLKDSVLGGGYEAEHLAVIWNEFNASSYEYLIPDGFTYLKTNKRIFTLFAGTYITEGSFWNYLSVKESLLLFIGAGISLILGIAFAVGRVKIDRDQALIVSFNEQLIYSQNQLRQERKNLRETVQELTRRNDQLKEFSTIVSHNIKAPVSSLSLLVSYIDEAADSMDKEEMAESFQNLELITKTLNQLTEDLFKTVRGLDGEGVEIQNIELKKFIEELLISTFKKDKDVKVEVDLSEWDQIEYSHDYLSYIVSEILTNSLKFRSPTRDLEIRIETSFLNRKKMLKISDNGRGFNYDIFSNNVFGMHRVYHSGIPGRGMGLFLIKLYVESLGGSVFLESKEDVGTTLMIIF